MARQGCAGNRAGGILSEMQLFGEVGLAGLGGIERFQFRPGTSQQFRLGRAAIGIFRDSAGHGDGALRQLIQHGGRQVAGGDDRLALADEDTQADILRFRPLELLPLAEAQAEAER